MIKILTVGGGGREHAAVEALHRSGAEIYAAMSTNNPGISRRAVKVLKVSEMDVASIVEFAQESGVEYAFIGPEAPLGEGIVDSLTEVGVKCASPSKDAARIETSKSFMRELLDSHNIDGNLGHATFHDLKDALAYIEDAPYELVVKPVGLTGGKGVKVQGEHLLNLEDTAAYVREIFEQDIGGAGVIFEERAIGEEFTLMVFCDGSTIAPMPLVQDHKRAFEGDVGPNTGGMGSYSAEDHLLPFVEKGERDAALKILQDIVDAMASEGCPYVGVMYGQFMLTRDGPRIIEINARFGDPEAMNVLPILKTGFADICKAMADGSLTEEVDFKNVATVCKYVVPEGYGVKSVSGKPIYVDERGVIDSSAVSYYANVFMHEGVLVTGSSRSVGVVGMGGSISAAEANCEKALSFVRGEAIRVRHDIGKPEIVQKRVEHMRQVRG